MDLSSGSGGGGCSVAVGTGSRGSNIDGPLVLAGVGLTIWGIRIRRRKP
jgi:MYXO-CTERM domain-containing protein